MYETDCGNIGLGDESSGRKEQLVFMETSVGDRLRGNAVAWRQHDPKEDRKDDILSTGGVYIAGDAF